jgi:lipopolysaccharide transport system ATP-binding protein
VIKVEHLCKRFKLYSAPSDRLKEILLRKKYHKEFTALDDVSFTVESGQTLGIVGKNGSGKSTILKLLSGVLLPDGGDIEIQGSLTGLLELGTGFNPEFTGLQNIYMNGTFLGMSRETIDERLDDIIAFTELGDFIHEPLKIYSSGMVMRLAFSVAIHAMPQCFLVDEALSVGDASFQQKCMARIKQFKEDGGSIIFVSHDMNAVKVLCDKALLLSKGKVEAQGDPETIINLYNAMLQKSSPMDGFCISEEREATAYGNRKVRITQVDLLDEQGEPAEVFISGKPMSIRLHVLAQQDITDLSLGVLIRDRFGQDIFGTNSFHLGENLELSAGEQGECTFFFDAFNIGPGKYSVTVAAHVGESHVMECFEWIDWARSFEIVVGGSSFIGLIKLDTRLSMHVGENSPSQQGERDVP